VAANKLAPEDIDEAAIDAQLKATCSWPDPVTRPPPRSRLLFHPARTLDSSAIAQALILQFCPELLLGGLLPWNCRVSHHLPMGRLRHATAAALHSALVEYDSVQQRHGA
jgi:hypothetical protein